MRNPTRNRVRLFTAERYITINNVVQHVREMAAQYEFVPTADSALDAVRGSADLLRISLSDEDAAVAVQRLLDIEGATPPYIGVSNKARPLPSSQLMLLARRFEAARAIQPQLGALRSVLLEIGGLELVAPPGGMDRGVSLLLAQGVITEGRVTFLEMRESDCHVNVFKLWSNRHIGMIGYCTGYALSDDGLWRQHSWGLLQDGILETTVAREVYFGITYPPDVSDRTGDIPPTNVGGR